MKLWIKRIGLALAGLLALLGIALVWLYAAHGRALPYPDTRTPPLLPSAALERVVALDFPLGNVAAAPSGRVFFNTHPFAQAQRFSPATLFELKDGKPEPYPSLAHQAKLQGVFGMTVDQQNRLWVIEPRGLDHKRSRLTAFDLNTNQVAFEHWFAPDEAQFVQDLRVSPDGTTVFIADTGLFRFTKASLIVFDVASKSHHSLLQTAPSAQPQNWMTQRFDGKPHTLGFGLVAFVVGLDGIELSKDGAWLYFAAMNHDSAFRVPTTALKDKSLSAAALNAKIERVGPKPLSDGITLDAQGRLLLTDIEHGAIARLTPAVGTGAAKLETLVANPSVRWSDGITLGPDGSIWLTDSAIPAYIDQLAMPPTREALRSAAPYGLYRIKAQ